MSDESVMQIVQHILALQPTCLHHGQDALHEPATRRTPQPKLRLRHNTARRTNRSMKLFVGSTPSTLTNVHKRFFQTSRFSLNAATGLIRLPINPSMRRLFMRRFRRRHLALPVVAA